jgi:hypothetical protein
VSPSIGLLTRVPCWNPLGLRPGDLHTPNYFLFSGIGVLFISPRGEQLKYVFQILFEVSNNEVEYEAL